MNVYAESSAVLAWLLGERRGKATGEILGRAEAVFGSDVTLVECDRGLIRLAASGAIREADAAGQRAALAAASNRWHVLRVSTEMVERARRPFPVEPVRALDALHLSSVLAARRAMPDIGVLSLDERVRTNAAALGFPILP